MKTKAIINGKRYNTQTATKLASYGNNLGDNDFRYLSEALYKTPKGEYFLSGAGGANTKYSISEGNTRWNGSRIDVLTPDQARAWLEEHQKLEALESEFGKDIIDA